MVVSKYGSYGRFGGDGTLLPCYSKVLWCPGMVVMVPRYHGILRYGGLVVSMVVTKYGSDGTMVY